MSTVVERLLAVWFEQQGVVPATPIKKPMGRPIVARQRKLVVREKRVVPVASPEDWAEVIAKYPIPSGNEPTSSPMREPRRIQITRRPNYEAF